MVSGTRRLLNEDTSIPQTPSPLCHLHAFALKSILTIIKEPPCPHTPTSDDTAPSYRA